MVFRVEVVVQVVVTVKVVQPERRIHLNRTGIVVRMLLVLLLMTPV